MTSTQGDDRLTRDAFLGGRVMAWQPARGYRAGVDPVLLAASVAAKPGDAVLDLGTGVGVAALCLHARVPDLALTGVEVQAAYADLARRNALDNSALMEVVTCDLRSLPGDLRQRQFDHVIMNPPYFDRSASNPSADPGRDAAFGGATPTSDWIDVAARRLRPRGWLTMIQRIERLPEVLGALTGRLGSVAVRPITGRTGRDADRVLLRARKDGRAPFRLLAPLVLHHGDRHLSDAEDYAPEVAAILREAAPLGWCD